MLSCSNREVDKMEPQEKQTGRTPDFEERERQSPASKQDKVKLPFASEGLEQVRDSHT
jgi:hypothetical protein